MIVLTRLTSIDYQLGLTGDPGQPVNPGGQFDFSVLSSLWVLSTPWHTDSQLV